MTVTELGAEDRSSTGPIIDACVFHDWNSSLDLTPYMDEGWAQLVTRSGQPGGPLRVGSQWLYRNPRGGKLETAYPENGIPGSVPAFTKAQLAGLPERARVVLGYDEGLLATGFPHQYFARAAVKAANDWTLDCWFRDGDDQFFALVLIQTALPSDAAAEIRRVGADERFVGIALGANGLGRSFGHRHYWPIYEAATELSLPIVLQVGSDAMTDQCAPPMAGGLAATYAEYKVLGAHPTMTHAASLVMDGVFDRFPSLKVLLVGCGAAWLPGFLWRMDYFYKSIKQEAPWMQRLPSEYFLEHVRFATYGLEWPRSTDAMIRLLSTLPHAETLLLYGSGYPNYDADEPNTLITKLPETWRDKVMYENAASFFRWPHRLEFKTSMED